MRKLKFVLLGMLLTIFSGMAQKSLYIPNEWKNRTDTLIYAESDPDNRYTWSKSRSKESENFIVYWDKYYGNSSPSEVAATYRVDIEDLLVKCESFYAMNDRLGFSSVPKYKMMVLVNHSTDWICYGGGYDDVVGALWLSPSTCKPVGHSVAHEVGHSFQYQVYAIYKGNTGFRAAIGNGSTFWEQTAQWQANQSYPELKWDQSWGLFEKTHNYAMTHEWHRYQSYWWHYFLAETYGSDFIGELWRHDAGRGKDPNEVLMDLLGLPVDGLYEMYFQYALRMATMDLDVTREDVDSHGYRYDYVSLGGSKHQVSYSSCPQSTGFNIIPLNVPVAGSSVSVDFVSLENGAKLSQDDSRQYFDGEKFVSVNRDAYNQVTDYEKRGFRLGFVALKGDGSREYIYNDTVYCAGKSGSEQARCEVGCVVPDGVKRLFLVVSPSPSAYYQHKWDENIANDDQWPYTVEFHGTNVLGAASLSENGEISDAEIVYDVYFPQSSDTYQSASVKIEGTAASVLGTALQMQASALAGVLDSWNASEPSDGRAMFYALNADESLVNAGSTANGYGHWFNSSGDRCEYASGSLFSEFDPSALTFSLGQYPGKLRNGSNYVIRQAIQYRRGTEEAMVVFRFNVHITDTRTGYELTSVYPASGATAVSLVENEVEAKPVAIYSLMGERRTRLHRGLNLLLMSDGTWRKVLER